MRHFRGLKPRHFLADSARLEQVAEKVKIVCFKALRKQELRASLRQRGSDLFSLLLTRTEVRLARPRSCPDTNLSSRRPFFRKLSNRRNPAYASIPWLRRFFWQASQPLHEPFGDDSVQSEVELQIGCSEGSPPPGILRKRISRRIERSELYLTMVDAIFIDRGSIFGGDLQQISRV